MEQGAYPTFKNVTEITTAQMVQMRKIVLLVSSFRIFMSSLLITKIQQDKVQFNNLKNHHNDSMDIYVIVHALLKYQAVLLMHLGRCDSVVSKPKIVKKGC